MDYVLPMRMCVVNFADKSGWYPQGQRRLRVSLVKVGFEGDIRTYSDHRQIFSPSHKEVPFAFKVHLIRKAQQLKYDLVLWADASIYAIKPVEDLFKHIAKHGYMFQRALPHMTGNWCSDAALKTLDVTREEALKIEELAATCMGFDLRNPTTRTFIEQWFRYATDMVTFMGSKTNENQQVSTDPRVQGHRHDQTAASVIAHKMGLQLTPYDVFFSQYPSQQGCLMCRREI